MEEDEIGSFYKIGY